MVQLVIRSFILTLGVLTALTACGLRRAEQDNFLLDASSGGVDVFVEAVSKDLDASVKKSDVSIPDADPGVMFTLTGEGVTVIIQPMGDHRCEARQNGHITYKESKYYVDLVYRTSSNDIRNAAKQKLLYSASQVKQQIIPFVECKY